MARQSAAALHGKARRFVDGNDPVINVNDPCGDVLEVAAGRRLPGWSCHRRRLRKRWQPYRLASLEPGPRTAPPAIETDLARTQAVSRDAHG